MCIRDRRRLVLGEITREEFMIKFTGAGKVYMHHFQDFLFATYERKSFPETFFHPQIAQALCATGKLSDPNTIQQRITAVSYTHLRAHETPEHLVCRLF